MGASSLSSPFPSPEGAGPMRLRMGFLSLRFPDGPTEASFRSESFSSSTSLHLVLLLSAAAALAFESAYTPSESSRRPSRALDSFAPSALLLLVGATARAALPKLITGHSESIQLHLTLVNLFLAMLPHLELLLASYAFHASSSCSSSSSSAPFNTLCSSPSPAPFSSSISRPFSPFYHQLFPALLCSVGSPAWCRGILLLLGLRASSTAPSRGEAAVRTLGHLACTLTGHVLEYGARRDFLRRKELLLAADSSVRADSRLNHILKNKSAEAGFLVGELHAGLSEIQTRLSAMRAGDDAVCGAPASDGSRISPALDASRAIIGTQAAHLLEHIAKLQQIHAQTSQWIHQRQLFIQLQHGSYVSRLVPTNLTQLLRTAMRASDGDVKIRVPRPAVIALDAAILRLQLEEARSNALKYRMPGSQLVVIAKLRRAASAAGSGADWEMHLTMDNENRDGVPVLTEEQCRSVFNEGHIGDHGRHTSTQCALGNGVGLDNVAAAARAARGRAWLSTYVDTASGRAHTVFHTVLAARVDTERALQPACAELPSPPGRPKTLAAERPPGTPRLRSRTTSCSLSSSVHSAGSSFSDLPSTVGGLHTPLIGCSPSATVAAGSPSCAALSHGARAKKESLARDAQRRIEDMQERQQKHAVLTACGRRPVCFALDDSPLLQLALLSAFQKLGADRVSCATGQTAAEQDAFADMVLGEGAHRRELAGSPHADIVVLDQELSLEGEERPSGLDQARTLHERGYRGMIALHSGLRPEELRAVEGMPFIDVVLQKGGNPKELANDLALAYLNRAYALASDRAAQLWSARACSEDSGDSSEHSDLLVPPVEGCTFRRRSLKQERQSPFELECAYAVVGGCVY
mmetsp:Transcript_21260/g.59368  ORF Transcript_21260/g.59368 Transcript_21260/m.59368 type:complete len:865 (+) Transcript_21260:72-2666(+)